MIICKTHPRYRGIRRTTTGCLKCRIIFGLRRLATACGAPITKPSRAPKAESVKVKEFCAEFLGTADEAQALGPSQEFPGVMERRRFTTPQEDATTERPPNTDWNELPVGAAQVEYESFLHLGGALHGRITYFREDAPVIYDGYCLTHFADGSRAYVFANISYPFAERYLEQYRTTGDMKPCVDDAAPPQRYEKFLFVGGPANLQIREVGESHDSNGARPCELTMPYDLNIYIYRMRVTDWTSNPYPVAYVLDGTSDSELATQLEAYRSLGPLDSGGKLC